MEHLRGSEFGTLSFQRCHFLSCQMVAESMQIDAQKTGIRHKDKSSSRRPKFEEMPLVPEQAMEFLSRTWNPSSSDIFQTLSPSCLGASAEEHHEGGEIKEDEDGDKELDTVRFHVGKSQLFNQIQTWGVLASGKPSSKQCKHHRLNQTVWPNVGQIRVILRGYFLDSISLTGSQRRRRRDKLRLHSAQADAAVSVAQLAAAIAAVVSACDPPRSGVVDGERGKLGAVLASAATLVATVCAEAAESAGAHRPRVTSAVKTGLESHSITELLTLTAAAATCLRGAAVLKLRAADVRGLCTGASGNGSINAIAGNINDSIQKGSSLRVCLPCGKVRVRTVAVFSRHGNGGTVALRLGTKRLRGAFTTYEYHKVLAVLPGGEAMVDGRRCFTVALSTSAGTAQLLLEDQTHFEVWKDAIQGMLPDGKLKHAKYSVRREISNSA